jgi:inorganic pyrophosphatase
MKVKTKPRRRASSWDGLEPLTDEGLVNVVIETPRQSRNKFKYDEKLGLFRLGSVLPAGAAFPYDFGFVPKTKAEDGDPCDVLLLMDEPAYPGCLVEARLIGAIEAEQTEDGDTTRNDRLIAVANNAHDYANMHTVSDINENLLKELEHFFISYNESRGKKFKLLGVCGPKRALKLLKKSMRGRS